MSSENAQSTAKQSGWLAKLRAMPNESGRKMLIVTVSLCFVCSLIVSGTAVSLRPLQEANKALERNRVILEAAGRLGDGQNIQALFDELVEIRLVDLATGEYVESADVATYDQRNAAKDPDRNYVIPDDLDVANINRRAKHAAVYLIKREGRVENIILPVHGYGLWSTMYGFLALEKDANTVAGLSFYEHAETPGLGGEVDNPKWRAQWQGKLAYDDKGAPRIEVIKGRVDNTRAAARYQIDGLAGATLTANGVSNMVRYWLGENGFGAYLARLRTQEG